MAFTVGQKVVCIYDGAHPDGAESPARAGEVYTVAASWHNGWFACIELYEAPTSAKHGGYAADRFRPFVSRKTDISIFHEILDRVNSGETELVE